MEEYRYELSKDRITHACRYHVVWCPTYRRPVFNERMRIRMKELIEEVCAKKQITILDLQIEPNCVYLHADMPPVEAVNDIVHCIKKHTASALKKEFPELCSKLPSLWTLHYFVSTDPKKPERMIEKWIEAQPRCYRSKKRMKAKNMKLDACEKENSKKAERGTI